MARIAGIDLPDQKRIDIGLTAIYGIGRVNSIVALKQAQVDPAKRVKDLSSEEVSRLQEAIDRLPTEGSLREKITQDINRLQTMGSYRGLRHKQGLPVRGQRTRANARTKRGKRKTVGTFKKEELTKKESPQSEKEKENE